MNTSSTKPFFGRAWGLTVTPQTGPSAGTPIVISSDSFEPEALRFTFEITQYAFPAFWRAEIIIYNANGPITSGPSKNINLYQAIIQEGDMVTLSAGYQADYPYPAVPPVIWNGPVFYTIQDRVDVVDQRLILYCVLNRALTTQNFINATIPSLSDQFKQARLIATQATTQIGINTQQLQTAISSANPQRGAAQLPRGKSFLGNPAKYLTALADQNGLLSWFGNTDFNVDCLQYPLGRIVGTYAPVTLEGGPPQTIGNTTLSLIGQPQQTQLGVNFRILLDPNVQIVAPLVQVGIDLQYVRQSPVNYPLPKGSFPPLPLVNNYVVIGVKFTGDTRGNPWYTDITGASQISTAIQIIGSGFSDPTGN